MDFFMFILFGVHLLLESIWISYQTREVSGYFSSSAFSAKSSFSSSSGTSMTQCQIFCYNPTGPINFFSLFSLLYKSSTSYYPFFFPL